MFFACVLSVRCDYGTGANVGDELLERVTGGEVTDAPGFRDVRQPGDLKAAISDIHVEVTPGGKVQLEPEDWELVALFGGKMATLATQQLTDPQMPVIDYDAAVKSCPLCHKVFKTKRWFKAHCLTAHTPSSRIQCTKCDKSYGTTTEVNKHMKAKHPEPKEGEPDVVPVVPVVRTYQCSQCQVVPFASLPLLSAHARSAHPASTSSNLPCPCPWCQKRYGTAKKLSDHKRLCKENPDFEWKRCSVLYPKCAKKYAKLSDLHTHMRNAHNWGGGPLKK
jgi:hypothetical protein